MHLLQTEWSRRRDASPVSETFPGQTVPRYAIFSHTWEADEVSFGDVQGGKAAARAGFAKVKYAASQACRDGFDYIWIDTCCIDKSSSAELSEAINSMYMWYANAAICYAYLADVPAGVDLTSRDSEFATSRWFTRGWTLQELLAPKELLFYSRDWVSIGNKWSLHRFLASITNIDDNVLTQQRPLESVSIAIRMSWAARRETTRLEDVAYCLMGLFSVNMPMLYGEGHKAFQRLQEEIMKNSNDQSLFAWVDPDISNETKHGMLADSPAAFGHHKVLHYSDSEEQPPFLVNNGGLHMELHLTACFLTEDIFAAALNCPALMEGAEGFVAIYLRRLMSGSRQYARISCNRLGWLQDRGGLETVFVKQHIVDDTHCLYRYHQFELRTSEAATNGIYKVISAQGAQNTHIQSHYAASNQARKWVLPPLPVRFSITKKPLSLAAAILFRRVSDDKSLVVLLGCLTDTEVGFDAQEYSGDSLESMESLQERFHPQPAGTPLLLGLHNVRVDATSIVETGVKSYLIDVTLGTTARANPPPNTLGVFEKVTEPKKSPTWQGFGRRRGQRG